MVELINKNHDFGPKKLGYSFVISNKKKYEKGYKVFRAREAKRIKIGQILDTEEMFSLPYDGYQYVQNLKILFSYYKNFPKKFEIAFVRALGEICACYNLRTGEVESFKSKSIQIIDFLTIDDLYNIILSLEMNCFVGKKKMKKTMNIKYGR